MATDRSGSLLFVADDTFGVAVFSINGAGSLSQLGDVAIANAGQVQDLVAYPPRMASNADLSVAISASSPNVVAGQNVTYTITVTNNGADPAAATVTDSSAVRLHACLVHCDRQRRLHRQLSGSELLSAAERRNANRNSGRLNQPVNS